MVAPIDWSSDRLAEHRRTELQRLIRTARDLSPWHRKHTESSIVRALLGQGNVRGTHRSTHAAARA